LQIIREPRPTKAATPTDEQELIPTGIDDEDKNDYVIERWAEHTRLGNFPA
jgi:hypothetical protein